MLKTLRGLILGLVVLAGSAYVTPTYASSAFMVISQIQAGGALDAADEVVVIYNNSPEPIDVAGWCLVNKNDAEFACFNDTPGLQVLVPPNSHAVIVSQPRAVSMVSLDYALVFEPVHAGYGSITAGSDRIELIDGEGDLVDRHQWDASLRSGYSWQRASLGGQPLTYIDTDQLGDWLQAFVPYPPQNHVELLFGEAPPDACPNIEGYQPELPEGLVLEEGECREVELPPTEDEGNPEEQDDSIEVPEVYISEALPNVEGSDVGNEFIELHNPSDEEVLLEGYEILMGESLEKSVAIPAASLPAGGYLVLSNAVHSFSLLNSHSQVALKYGELVFAEMGYENPPEDTSWAYVDGEWQYTSVPTPGSENVSSPMQDEAKAATAEKTSSLKPCADNQYRNPETNRCRLISSSSSSSLKPCAANQYRSPETNRCRKMVEMTEVDYGVLGEVEERSSENSWQLWVALGGGLLIGGGYAAWEWRREIAGVYGRLLKVFHRKRS